MTAPKKPGASVPSSKLRMNGTPRIIPNKNRRLQVAPTRRRLFSKTAKAEFLEWFAATCNISLAARKTGFHYRTVLRHWRENAAFGAQCEEALRIGYVRLEALALQGAEEALRRPARRLRGDRAAPAETLAMDATVALQLLREHKRGPGGASGGSGPRGKPGRRPRVATNAEVREALLKRLKAFGIRVSAEEAAGRAPPGETPPAR